MSAGAFRIRSGDSSGSDLDMVDPNTVMLTATATQSASPEMWMYDTPLLAGRHNGPPRLCLRPLVG